MSMTSIDISVREGLGTYQTNTVQKMRASCTAGARQTAERLGEKLFGLSLSDVKQVPFNGPRGTTRWQLTAKEYFAWCWQSGLIDVGPKAPEGAIVFAKGMERPLVEVINVYARHGMGAAADQLLVPGVPEAEEGDPKVDALTKWVNWCAINNGSHIREGVVFGNNL